MALRSLITRIRDGWEAYRNLSVVSKDAPLYAVVARDFPSALRPLQSDPTIYKLQGSTGAGNITAAPWIATFDTSVTTSATRGFYLVYLFSVDMRRVYLSLAFGTTQFKEYFSEAKERHEKMASAARQLRALANPRADIEAASIDLSANRNSKLHADYEFSNIFAIRYEIDNLPSDVILADDYRYMLELYKEIVTNPLLPSLERLLEAQIEPPEQMLAPIVIDFEPRPPKSSRKNKNMKGGVRISKESKKVGDRGEQVVFDHEAKLASERGRCASTVIWHAKNNETPGWDISSIDETGQPIRIEVKASVGSTVSSFILTANEWEAAKKYGDSYCVYIVTNVFRDRPKIETIRNPSRKVLEGLLTERTASVLIGLNQEGEIDEEETERVEEVI